MVFDDNVILEDMEKIFDRDLEWESLDDKTFLITGAYGMLASYVIFFLAYLVEKKGYKLYIIAQGRDKEKAKKRFGELFDKDYFLFCNDDLRKQLQIEKEIDYIIHAASVADPRKYAINPVEVIEPNVLGTYNLLELSIRKNVSGFLLFSSGDVYGKIEMTGEILENTTGVIDPLDVHSCYGLSKRMAETMCAAFYKEYFVPIKIARIGHTYGPTMDIYNDPRVFASFMKNALEGRDIELLSDGLAKRPFCYIADGVAAYFTILIKGENGSAYNVCNNEQFLSMREFAKIVANVNKGKQLKIIYKERNKNDTYVKNKWNIENRPSDKKLRSLGFSYKYTTEIGIERTFRYLKTVSSYR